MQWLLLGVAICSVVFGKDQMDVLRKLRNESFKLKDENRIGVALEKQEEAIGIIEDIVAQDDLSKKDRITYSALQSQVYSDFSHLLALEKQYESALNYLSKARVILHKVYGTTHPSYGLLLRNVGDVYLEMGDYKNAIVTYKQLKYHLSKSLGVRHEAYMEATLQIGKAHTAMGNYKKAKRTYGTLLKQLQHEDGEGLEDEEGLDTLPGIGHVYMGYSTALANLKEKEQALAYATRARKVLKAEKGSSSIEYAFSLNNLAGVYSTMGEHDKSISYLKAALRISKKIHGTQHPLVQEAERNLNQMLRIHNEL